MTSRTATVLSLLMALQAGADTLTDVRAAVGRLTAKQPVRATYAVDISMKAAGKYANSTTARNVALEVVHDSNGITMSVPQAMLDKKDAVSTIQPSSIVEAMDYRQALLKMMEGATVTREQRLPHQGKPARLLVLKLKEPEKEEGTVQIGSSKTDMQLSLWIGDDNLPLDGERLRKTTGGFLFIKGTNETKTTYTFGHVADRLMLLREESQESGSGMGQKIDVASVQTLTVH